MARTSRQSVELVLTPRPASWRIEDSKGRKLMQEQE